MFTYGPLGFLSTRNTQYVSDFVIFISDIFTFFCCFHLFRQALQRRLSFFWLGVVVIFYFKGIEFACEIFSFFMLFAIVLIHTGFRGKTTSFLCAITGTIVFFVKVNYGIIALPLLAILTLYALYRKKTQSAIILSATSIILFTILTLCLNISVLNYIKNNLRLIV